MNLSRLLMIDLSGSSLSDAERVFLSERRPGGVCLFGRNVVDRVQVAEYVAELRSLAGDDLLVAVDQEGGGVVRIDDIAYPPSAMALGAADDPELTRQVAAATGRGLRALGINVDFAPVADVNSNPANPVIADRSFGADPEHVARHVVAFIGGLQSQGVAATAKHFPGHGDVAVDSHLELPRLERSAEMLERLELPPFRAAVTVGAAAVMSAHIVLSEIDSQAPATLSPAVLTGLLRDRLEFDGVVFTDSLDMKAIAGSWGAHEAAVRALSAGADMPVHVGPVSEHEAILGEFERALGDGRLEPKALEASLRRVDRLAKEFPARPGPALSAVEGDDRLLDEAAHRGLVSLGHLPDLRNGAKVLLVASAAVRQEAATQATLRPAAKLAAALRDRGAEIEEVEYDPRAPTSAQAVAAAKATSCEHLLFVSTSRTRLSAGERELGRALAASAGSFLHVAMWNPYAVAELPGPALVTFGWRERSARAAAAALTGRAVTGVPPVPLRTFDDLER